MSKKIKISIIIVVILIAVAAIVQFQAKRIIIGLIEANSSDKINVEIGRLRIHPFESSITLLDVMVLVRGDDSDDFKKTTIKKTFLDVASLWDFFTGGTLVIEKLECDGMDLALYSQADSRIDNTRHSSFDLRSSIQRIKTDAIRFQIQDIRFTDINLTLVHDRVNQPTTIRHLNVHVQDLYLSADSILKRKPLIEFSLPGQAIVFPKGLSVGFDSLFFSTADNSIQLDKLELLSPPAAVDNAYKVHSDKVRIAHFDFESLYTKGIIMMDSVFLERTDITVAWKLNEKDQADNKTSGLPNLPELHVNHLIIDQLASDIKLRKDSIENSFKIENSYVTVQDFHHQPDSSQTISTRDFDIVLAKYNTFLSKKSTSISFDTVRLQKHRLFLLNFQLYTEGQKLPVLQTSAFELKQVDWHTLLVYKNLVADEAVVLNPTVRTTIKPNSKSDPAANLVLLNTLKELLNVNLFTLKNATAYVKLVEKNADIILRGTNATIRVNDMLESKDVNMGLDAIKDFSFLNLQVKSPDFVGWVRNYNYRDGISNFGSVTYQAHDDYVNVSISDLYVGKINWNESQHNLTLDGLGWKSVDADVTVNTPGQQTKEKGSTKMPSIHIHKVRGGNIRAGYQMKDLKVSTWLRQINLETLQLGDSIRVRGIDIKGNQTDFHVGPIKSTINAFSLDDLGGSVEKISLHRMADDTLVTYIDRITFSADLPALAQKKVSVDQLEFEGMKTRYSKRDSIQTLSVGMANNLLMKDIGFVNKKLTIGSMMLESGPIDFAHEKKISLREDIVGNSSKMSARRFRMGVDTLLHMDTTKVARLRPTKVNPYSAAKTSDNPLFTIKSTSIRSDRGGISLFMGPIETVLSDSSRLILAKVSSIKFNNIQVKSNDLSAHVFTGSLNDLVINSSHFNDAWKIIKDNYPSAAIHNMKARIETGGNLIQFDRFDYNPKPGLGIVQGFEFRPLKERQAFLDDSFYQTNYMHAKMDTILFSKFNASQFVEDSVVRISSVYIASPSLEIGRDKTHPFFSNTIKLLPTNAFQKLGVKFKVDSLRFGEGKINYTEKSKITGKEGSIHFTKLWGLVRNVKNVELKDGDTLYIRGGGRFLDSATVGIRVRESYRDTLAGFLMTTQVSPFHTSILNNSLVPMVAVEFQSGFVDTLQMRAVGREYLSLGTMKFLYHDLKVNFLDRNDTSKHSVKNAILKFAANNFVIRANNKNRVGTVFFERDRQRAVFHYWVKMILSGATTSVGAKSNKKQIKKYMKDLNQKKLPPIDKNLEI